MNYMVTVPRTKAFVAGSLEVVVEKLKYLIRRARLVRVPQSHHKVHSVGHLVLLHERVRLLVGWLRKLVRLIHQWGCSWLPRAGLAYIWWVLTVIPDIAERFRFKVQLEVQIRLLTCDRYVVIGHAWRLLRLLWENSKKIVAIVRQGLRQVIDRVYDMNSSALRNWGGLKLHHTRVAYHDGIIILVHWRGHKACSVESCIKTHAAKIYSLFFSVWNVVDAWWVILWQSSSRENLP